MTKKDSKISELERLRIQRIKLQAESEIYLRALDEHLDYIRNNGDALLVETVISTVKSKLPLVLQSLISLQINTSADKKEKSNTPKKQMTAIYIESIIDHALEIVPFFFKGLKPVVVVLVLKKLKEIIFR